MKKENTHKGFYGFYTESDLDSMRSECCGHEYDVITECGAMCDTLYEGCVGWRHVVVELVIEYWEENILPDTVGEEDLTKMAEAMEVGRNDN